MGFKPYVITYTQNQDYKLNYDPSASEVEGGADKQVELACEAIDPKREANTIEISANDTVNHSVNQQMMQQNNKILRAEASIYVQFDSSIAYADSLANFLLKQGLVLAAYQDKFAYKADDVILLSDKTIAAPSAKTFYMDQDKARLWAFLKQEFKL